MWHKFLQFPQSKPEPVLAVLVNCWNKNILPAKHKPKQWTQTSLGMGHWMSCGWKSLCCTEVMRYVVQVGVRTSHWLMICVWGNQFSLNYLICRTATLLVMRQVYFASWKPNSGHSFMVTVQTPAFTGSKDPGQLVEGYGTMLGWEESSSPGILWEHFQGMQPVHPLVHPPNGLDKAWLDKAWWGMGQGSHPHPQKQWPASSFSEIAGERNASDMSGS